MNSFEHNRADIVEYCDGWIPLATRHDIVGQVARVREAIASAGRDAGSFEVTAYSTKVEVIEKLEEAGVDLAEVVRVDAAVLRFEAIAQRLDELRQHFIGRERRFERDADAVHGVYLGMEPALGFSFLNPSRKLAIFS